MPQRQRVELYTGLTKKDREHLFSIGMVKMDPDTSKLQWNEADFGDYRGRFDDIQALCRNGNLVLFRGCLMIWEFPIDFLLADGLHDAGSSPSPRRSVPP
jgi:hypothetical protein